MLRLSGGLISGFQVGALQVSGDVIFTVNQDISISMLTAITADSGASVLPTNLTSTDGDTNVGVNVQASITNTGATVALT
jgi:hypothetical protein